MHSCEYQEVGIVGNHPGGATLGPFQGQMTPNIALVVQLVFLI